VAEKTVVAERIRQARADRGWKQKHLAAEVSVEPITVSRWERGATTPDLQVLGLVAKATGKPLSYFVGGAGEAEASSSTLESAADRIEAAALRVAEASERMAAVASELVEELRAARSRT
jgi:transcriptional regulator with XRE-family HTH domain